MKTYISSELQNELREVTENHIFKSKVIGFNQPSEQAILKAKANRSQKAHSSIVSEQWDERPESSSKIQSESNSSTPVCKCLL